MQYQNGYELIQSFGEKYGLTLDRIFRLQLCCEELIYELLDKCYPNREDVDMSLLISYAELDGTSQIDIDCGGACYNPFEQQEDSMGVTILKNAAKQFSYRYTDSRNQIDIKL